MSESINLDYVQLKSLVFRFEYGCSFILALKKFLLQKFIEVINY